MPASRSPHGWKTTTGSDRIHRLATQLRRRSPPNRLGMARFAKPYWHPYAAHCFNRAYTQNSHPALIQLGKAKGHVSIRTDLIKCRI